MNRVIIALAVACASIFVACGLGGCASTSNETGLRGHLLIIGGGLDDDNVPVYKRLVELATPGGIEPRFVVMTAASGDQDGSAVGKLEALRVYCPGARVDVVTRETPTDEGVKLIDAATALFFTGGDQKRITTRYRPDGIDTPEASAMRRLLERGGVIAGTSAGDAMMSDPMFLTGRSAAALGIKPPPRANGEERDAALGPQLGKGMGFMPWALCESHFFERHRFGRLVAGIEAGPYVLGIGVGEDAAVEVDLSSGELIGVSVAESLLVDGAQMRRDGLVRSDIRTLMVTRGMRVPVAKMADAKERASGQREAIAPMPAGAPIEVKQVEEGQNRQLSSWRLFKHAQEPMSPARVLRVDGYEMIAWPDGRGWANVRVGP